MSISESEIYDVIVVGFGPAGIALATAIEDEKELANGDHSHRVLFLEKGADSSWQPEMLLPGMDIQHHFLRDFASPRNPRSRFTFPNYLKESGRLFDFGLLGGNPSRIEWADYCRWVSEQVAESTAYGHEVTSIEPVEGGGDKPIDLARVTAVNLVNDKPVAFLGRNIVLCTGRRPYVPTVLEPFRGSQVIHSHHFLSSLPEIDPESHPAFAVVGSGQSAIEVLLHLIEQYPTSQIFSISRNSGFRLYDLGHFSNQVFSPGDVDYVFGLEKERRKELLDEVKFTNYSSIDADVSRTLYLRIYEDRILERSRIHILKRSAIQQAREIEDGLELQLEDVYRESEQLIVVDKVFACTGFTEERFPRLLEGLRPCLALDDKGLIEVDRDYKLKTVDRMRVGLFVNGMSEATHGISDSTSFSMMALRADRTIARLNADRRGEADAAQAKKRPGQPEPVKVGVD